MNNVNVDLLGDNENPIKLTRYRKVMIPNIPRRHI